MLYLHVKGRDPEQDPGPGLACSLLLWQLPDSGIYGHHERAHDQVARPLLGNPITDPKDLERCSTERGVGVEQHIGERAIPALAVQIQIRDLRAASLAIRAPRAAELVA
jgi:hypothetical protein